MSGRSPILAVSLLIALGVASACGRSGLDEAATGTAGSPATVRTGPADGRCDLQPRLLVDAATYPAPAMPGPFKLGAGGLAVNGSDLYYVTFAIGGGPSMLNLAGAVMRVPVVGGAPTEIASGYVFGQPLFTDTSVILERSNAFPNTDADDVVTLPLAGGPPTALVTLGPGESPIAGPVTDGTFVYLATTDGVRALSLARSPARDTILNTDRASAILPMGGRLIILLPQGAFESLALPPAGDGITTVLATTPAGPSNLVACGDAVCWLAGNEIWRGDPVSGAQGQVGALDDLVSWTSGFVYDGASFFIAASSGFDASPNRIVVGPTTGADFHVLVRTNGAGGIAVDDECLYWTSAGGIFSLDKTVLGPIDQ